MAFSAVLATIYPNVINAFSMLGGFCAVPIVILYPGYIFVSLSRKKWTHPRKLILIVITTILSTMGFIAAILSMLNIFGLVNMEWDLSDLSNFLGRL